jgi:hypothetical protein
VVQFLWNTVKLACYSPANMIRSQLSSFALLPLVVCLTTFSFTACGGGGGGGGTSGGVGPSPGPQLTSISPITAPAGSTIVFLRANGTNFNSGSSIDWNGTALATTYLSAAELTASIPASDLIDAGTAKITVVNSGANSGTSTALTFSISGLAPAISSIAPFRATVGDPAVSVTVNGAHFESTSEVQWNGSALATTFVSSTQLTASVPASNLSNAGSEQVNVTTPSVGTSGSVVFYVVSGSTRISAIQAYAHDLIWDSARARLYASLDVSNAANGNTVAVINPVTGGIEKTQTAGTGSDLLALSSDGSYLWVAEDESSVVQRFIMPSLAPDISISLQNSAFHPPNTAVALAAAPGSPHTVAMAIGSYQSSPENTGGVAVYDDATVRGTGLESGPPGSGNMEWLQWGLDDTAIFGGAINQIPPMYDIMTAGPSGLTITSNPVYALYWKGHFDPKTQNIYDDGGQVLEAATGRAVGNFSLNTLVQGPTYCAVDSAQGVVFFLGQPTNGNPEYDYAIQAYDQKTFKLLGTLQLPLINGVATKLIRWGNSGLAFTVVPHPFQTNAPDPGYIYLVDGSFVNPNVTPDFSSGAGAQSLPAFTSMTPESAPAGASDTLLTVKGANLQPGAVVYWNSVPLSSTFENETELEATIPATKLANVSEAKITISNGDLTTLAVNSRSFSVTPINSGLRSLNLAALDISWDKTNGLLYAATWSDDTQYPNSIVAINPTSASVVNSRFAGPDPDIVRATNDGKLVYSATLNSDSITQMHAPGLDSPLTWHLGVQSQNSCTSPWPESLIALDLEPAPDASHTTAVMTGVFQYDSEWLTTGGSGGTISIFDDSSPRSTQFSESAPYYCFDAIRWAADDSTLYGSGVGLSTFSVDNSGILLASSDNLLFNGLYANFQYDSGTGYIYDDNGRVIDPKSGTLVGNLDSTGITIVDSTINKVFILGQTTGQRGTRDYTVASFDATTFQPVSSVTIPSMVDSPLRMVRWGASGLAVITYEDAAEAGGDPPGALYLLDSPTFVKASKASQTDPAFEAVQRTWRRQQLPHSGKQPSR